MAQQRIVCSGWRHPKTGELHPCGKVIGYIENDTPGDTHTICNECLIEHLKALGFSEERIQEILCTP